MGLARKTDNLWHRADAYCRTAMVDQIACGLQSRTSPVTSSRRSSGNKGGVVIHFIIVIYLCGVLGYICDDYFVPSLEIIAESLNVPSDVAGATFMAVGTSAPELFSSIIGSFITEGDIGLGTIVGISCIQHPWSHRCGRSCRVEKRCSH
ncbi:hypothetical protein MRX96_014102 [Rhipicephalus microplus]